MSDKQLHTFWVTAASYLKAGFASRDIDKFIVKLQETIQSFQEPLSADNLLVLAKLYAIQQVLHIQIRHIELRTLVALGRTQEAFAIARFHANAGHKFSGLAAIFDALSEKGQLDSNLLDELIVLTRQIEGIESQITSRDWLSKALAKSGRFDEALQIARSIPQVDHGLGRRSSALFIIASHLRNVSRNKQADQVFAEAQARYAEIKSSWDGISILVQRLSYLVENHRQDEFTAILEQLQDKLSALNYPHREHWFMQIAITLAKLNDKKLAEPFFVQATEVVRSLENGDRKIQSYSELVEALATSGYISDAQILLRELSLQAGTSDSHFAQSYVLTAQAKIFMQQGELEQAREATQRIIPWWRVPILNELTVLFAEKGQQTEAESVLNDILTASQQKTDWAQRADALTAMGIVWHNANYVREADFLFEKASEAVHIEQQEWPGRTGQEANRLVKALAQTQRFAQAREVAEHELLENERRGWRYDEALCDIALAAVQANHNVEAELGQISRFIAGNEFLLSQVAQVYVAAGRTADAEKIFDKAIEKTRARMRQSSTHLGYNTFGKLIAALERSGFTSQSDAFLDEAIQVALDNTDSYWRPRILYHMAICLARKSRLEQARAIIAEADTAAASKIYVEHSQALGEIALSLARSGQHQDAQAIFTQSWESVWRMSVYDIQEREARADAFYQLAKLTCEAGYITQARSATFAIEYGSNNHSVQRLATMLIQFRNYAEAFQIIGTDLSPKFSVATADDFLRTFAEWSIYLDQLRPGLSLAILQEIIQIMSWVFDDWQEINNGLIKLRT